VKQPITNLPTKTDFSLYNSNISPMQMKYKKYTMFNLS